MLLLKWLGFLPDWVFTQSIKESNTSYKISDITVANFSSDTLIAVLLAFPAPDTVFVSVLRDS
jgi:hypothetical protein